MKTEIRYRWRCTRRPSAASEPPRDRRPLSRNRLPPSQSDMRRTQAAGMNVRGRAGERVDRSQPSWRSRCRNSAELFVRSRVSCPAGCYRTSRPSSHSQRGRPDRNRLSARRAIGDPIPTRRSQQEPRADPTEFAYLVQDRATSIGIAGKPREAPLSEASLGTRSPQSRSRRTRRPATRVITG